MWTSTKATDVGLCAFWVTTRGSLIEMPAGFFEKPLEGGVQYCMTCLVVAWAERAAGVVGKTCRPLTNIPYEYGPRA
jgi:hypothetical protein